MPLAKRTLAGILNSMFGETSIFGALATPPVWYVGLSSTDPSTAVTEPAAGGYARVVTVATDWSVATVGFTRIDNAAVLTMPTATADWLLGVVLPYVVLYDALTLGDLLGWGNVATPKVVLTGDTISFPIAAITVTAV